MRFAYSAQFIFNSEMNMVKSRLKRDNENDKVVFIRNQ